MIGFSNLVAATCYSAIFCSIAAAGLAISSDGLDERDYIYPLTKRSIVTIPLQLQNGVFTANIMVAAQQFKVLVDTGSADLLLPASSCVNCENINTRFDTTGLAPLASPMGAFSGGMFQGNVFATPVTLGTFTATQKLIAARLYPQALATNAVGGVLGMAFESKAKSVSPPLFQNMLQTPANHIDHPMFSYFVSTRSYRQPTLTIGGDDPAQVDMTGLQTFAIMNTGFWEVALNSVTLRKTSAQPQAVAITAPNAMFDTGSNIVSAPAADVHSLFQNIPGAVIITNAEGQNTEFYKVPCGTMPDLQFTIGGNPTAYTIYGEDLETEITGDTVNCRVTLRAANRANWNIGNPFLKNVYTRFTVGGIPPANAPSSIGFIKLFPDSTYEPSDSEPSDGEGSQTPPSSPETGHPPKKQKTNPPSPSQ